MQILFLAHRIPYPPDKGERIRAFQQLQYLGARHDVDLFCFADSKACARNQEHLRTKCRSVHVEVLKKPSRLLRAASSFAGGQPISFGFFQSPRFAQGLNRLLQTYKYDVIFVYSSSMGQYIPVPAPAPVVVDFVDADSQKFRQYAATANGFRARLYTREADAVAGAERSLGHIAAVSLAVTRHDALELQNVIGSGCRVEVIPNGVQVPDCSSIDKQGVFADLRPFLLFVGTMSYPPNADAAVYFAREILPLVHKTRPGMKFVIVGRDPDRRVRELASLPGVLVTGEVPDAFAYFRSADVTVAPFRISQGFHNKIAESLALGTPVVTTARARDGIGLSDREGLFAADTPEEFTRQIEFALDPTVRRKVRENAGLVRKILSWDVSLAKLERLMMDAAAQSDTATYRLAVGH
jgi:sugar transferase (PEP-CTERM/EpsH1 system associated)